MNVKHHIFHLQCAELPFITVVLKFYVEVHKRGSDVRLAARCLHQSTASCDSGVTAVIFLSILHKLWLI